MTTSTSAKTVTSSPARLQWYHWALILVSSLLVIFLGGISFRNLQEAPGDFVRFAGVFLLWYHFVTPLLKTQAVFIYDDSFIYRMENTRLQIVEQFPYQFIKYVHKKSPFSMQIYFAPTSPVTFAGRYGDLFPLRQMAVTGNATDMAQALATLEKNNVVVSTSPLNTQTSPDPVRSLILILAVVAVISSLVLVFFRYFR